MKSRHLTYVLAGLTLLMLLLSVPGSLQQAHERGGFYIFSWEFLAEIPKRLTGPGRFRFMLQPLVAMILGIRSGLMDARVGRPPFLQAVILRPDLRQELVKSALENLLNVVLMGILMDSTFQWVLYGYSYPGAALMIGPLLVTGPYVLARGFTNRIARRRLRSTSLGG
jgi:hypothetical protein